MLRVVLLHASQPAADLTTSSAMPGSELTISAQILIVPRGLMALSLALDRLKN